MYRREVAYALNKIWAMCADNHRNTMFCQFYKCFCKNNLPLRMQMVLRLIPY